MRDDPCDKCRQCLLWCHFYVDRWVGAPTEGPPKMDTRQRGRNTITVSRSNGVEGCRLGLGIEFKLSITNVHLVVLYYAKNHPTKTLGPVQPTSKSAPYPRSTTFVNPTPKSNRLMSAGHFVVSRSVHHPSVRPVEPAS